MTRIAIVDKNKCKPNKCKKECMTFCPPQQGGKKVIDIEDIGSNSILNVNVNKKVPIFSEEKEIQLEKSPFIFSI